MNKAQHRARTALRRTVTAGAFVAAALHSTTAMAGNTTNILITGYWPPTNNMVRQFSTSADQNPGGWKGGNWENRGYNVYSYFPEFPGGVGTNPKGDGDLEVDYQDTAADWARITNDIKPAAIITFSRDNSFRGWRVEPAWQRWRLPGEPPHATRNIDYYTPDYAGNLYPTDVPIASEPLGNIRLSTLPRQDIVDDIKAVFTTAQITPTAPTFNINNPGNYNFGGGFLSGYIAYLGAWYHDQHNDPSDPFRNFAAGHIHVGQGLAPDIAAQATEITLRSLITYLDTVVPAPGSLGVMGAAAAAAGLRGRRS